MPTPTEPCSENPSTYVVQNRSNREELICLQIQNQLVTTSMGGIAGTA